MASKRQLRYRARDEARAHSAPVDRYAPIPGDTDTEAVKPAPDCQHGCNGDCSTSGSDVCDFTCHPTP